jgi:hypothetical protein
MSAIVRTLAAVGCLSVPGVVAGCYGNDSTAFPQGLEPWEENLAALPDPAGDDPCPEVLAFSEELTFMGTRGDGRAYEANSLHARGCIHQPPEVVWQAILDPQVARDHTAVNTFAVIDPPMPGECEGDYQTQINAGTAPFTVDFRLCWRQAVAEGTEDVPLLTATRWQKVWGSSAMPVLEGSLVSRPLEDHPEITVVEYQYHLNALTSSHQTIRDYIAIIYGRLLDRAHDRPLP